MRKETIIVRADGNAQIGAGHLMRCLSIMEAYVRLFGNREEILFVCADEQSVQFAEKKGFHALALHTDYGDMESELPGWEKNFAGGSQRRILVDSYYVTDAYLEGLRSCGKVFLLDDMQKKAFPADAVINYNAFADSSVYEKLYAGTKTELYIGSSFVPLRSQFENAGYRLSETVKNVLITTGGSDKDNIAGQILECIYREDMVFHLVVGSLSPWLEELKCLEKQKKGVRIHHDVQDMADLMQSCDMAVTAGGSTVYELAAVGVPFIGFSYAENQEALIRYLGEREIAGEAGAFHKNRDQTLEKMKKLFASFCDSRELREEYSRREQEMTDGKGALRLAEALRSII